MDHVKIQVLLNIGIVHCHVGLPKDSDSYCISHINQQASIHFSATFQINNTAPPTLNPQKVSIQLVLKLQKFSTPNSSNNTKNNK